MVSCWRNSQIERVQLPLVSSWTHFSKQVSYADSQKALIKYMLVTPQLISDYSVMKADLLFLIETTENL